MSWELSPCSVQEQEELFTAELSRCHSGPSKPCLPLFWSKSSRYLNWLWPPNLPASLLEGQANLSESGYCAAGDWNQGFLLQVSPLWSEPYSQLNGYFLAIGCQMRLNTGRDYRASFWLWKNTMTQNCFWDLPSSRGGGQHWLGAHAADAAPTQYGAQLGLAQITKINVLRLPSRSKAYRHSAHFKRVGAVWGFTSTLIHLG